MKKTNRVIGFDPKERILEKAKNYVESVDLFLDERDRFCEFHVLRAAAETLCTQTVWDLYLNRWRVRKCL